MFNPINILNTFLVILFPNLLLVGTLYLLKFLTPIINELGFSIVLPTHFFISSTECCPSQSAVTATSKFG